MKNYYNPENLNKICNPVKFLLLIFLSITFIFNPAYMPASAKKTISAEIKEAQAVFQNEKVKIDFTASDDTGTVKINAVLKSDKRIKITIAKNEKNGATYTYDLKNDTTAEVYPLQMGSGEYIVKIWFQIAGTQYKLGFTCTYAVNLSDANTPFLNPNQYVNYNDYSKITKIAARLTKDCRSDVEKVEAIYKFVINSIEYDAKKADAAIKGQLAGYLPSVDAVVESGKGICFDYAAVFAAMLRSQNIPAKLVIGQVSSNNTFHAWNEVYLKDTGARFTINNMQFYGGKFERLDPSFDSSSKSNARVLQFIGDSKNYKKIQEY